MIDKYVVLLKNALICISPLSIKPHELHVNMIAKSQDAYSIPFGVYLRPGGFYTGGLIWEAVISAQQDDPG